jgi:hypothetical protein
VANEVVGLEALLVVAFSDDKILILVRRSLKMAQSTASLPALKPERRICGDRRGAKPSQPHGGYDTMSFQNFRNLILHKTRFWHGISSFCNRRRGLFTWQGAVGCIARGNS